MSQKSFSFDSSPESIDTNHLSSQETDTDEVESSDKEDNQESSNEDPIPILEFSQESEDFENEKKKPQDLLFRKIIHPKYVKIQQGMRYNSTSTMFVDNTLSSPDMDLVIECISKAVILNMKKGDFREQDESDKFSIFNEELHPIFRSKPSNYDKPSEKDVSWFLSAMTHSAKLNAESLVIMLIYIERLIQSSSLKLTGRNWRRICLTTLLLASKVWDDLAVWNVDWTAMFPQISIAEINELEHHFLEFVEYNVVVKASTYAKYYFEVRALSEQQKKLFPLEPLDKKGKVRLEVTFYLL
ncbi:cyclin-y [Anaeramoeba ignava]|uniref:Cyclin-y n=1 Tax=Anaeramoeba ignava TaxID=1746090 RepID=A0A9Q0LU97_ANAIG|nr:cyclin-y [Anaeramoeba ignava]